MLLRLALEPSSQGRGAAAMALALPEQPDAGVVQSEVNRNNQNQ